MEMFYSAEKAVRLLISLLKQHNIKKIVASPGATNITFVASVMHDEWFEVYSCVDERSAAYMAVGMAEESGESIVLTCTGATASRNYLPAITEAYYRKLPILAVTATQDENRIGHLIPQVLDRSVQPNDTYIESQHIPFVESSEDEWEATIRLNRAILALHHHGGGPVHLNFTTHYLRDYSVKELEQAKVIRRWDLTMASQPLPQIPQGRVGIRFGSHKVWTGVETQAVEKFCEAYGAVVFCELGSNYAGKYRVYSSLLNYQKYEKDLFDSSLIIHIGEVPSYGNDSTGRTKEVWRVNPDGELRDPMHRLTNVFEMQEVDFFNLYANLAPANGNGKTEAEQRVAEFKERYEYLHSQLTDLPFSNAWLAQQTAHRLPANSKLHVAILNSQRTWTIFELPKSIQGECFVNTGGFGIDGCMSSAIGGAIVNPDVLHFLVIGDLSFFYDMNSLGNKHIGNNLRILFVNNGKGTEFRNYNHPGAMFGEEADKYIAAGGHFGNKSHKLIKHFAEDLGYEYISATNKEEYLDKLDKFISPKITDRSMVFEVFTDSKDESDAIYMINNIIGPEETTRDKIREALPSGVVNLIRKIKN